MPECNCGRRGTRREGCCIYCMEQNLDWRIWQTVRKIVADTIRRAPSAGEETK